MNANNLPDYSIPANKVPLVEPKRVEKSDLDILKRRIVDNLKKINGTLIAHYYVAVSYTHLTLPTTPYV